MKFYYYKTLFAFFLLLLLTPFSSAQTERDKGFEFYEKGDYKTAVEILQKAVETDQTDSEAWGFLGMAFAKIKDRSQARKAFNKADKFYEKSIDETYNIPLKITSKRVARYTDTARRNGVEGRIKLAVEFRYDGKTGLIFPLMELPDGLTENAVKAAGDFEFIPASRNGKPTTVIRFIEFSFAIY